LYNLWQWCEPCQINYLEENFKNWTSGSEKIDDFIQEMQLKTYYSWDIIFEWVPYDQFKDVKKISENYYTSMYLAIWRDGPFNFTDEYAERDKRIILKCLHNSRNTPDKFLSEV